MARGNINNFGDKKHTLTQEDRVKGGQQVSTVKKVLKSFKEQTQDRLTEEDQNEIIDIVLKEAKKGNLNAVILLLKMFGETLERTEVAVEKLPNILIERTQCKTEE